MFYNANGYAYFTDLDTDWYMAEDVVPDPREFELFSACSDITLNIRQHTMEDFTLPHIFHVDSMWTPGQLLESMWSLDIFSLVVAQPIFCLESIWSPTGVHLDSSCSIWTTWGPHQNTMNMKSPSKTPHGSIAFNCGIPIIIYNKKSA